MRSAYGSACDSDRIRNLETVKKERKRKMNLTKLHFITGVMLVLLMTAPVKDAFGDTRQDKTRKTKIQLQRENGRLREVIDSLESALAGYEKDRRINDSIADEIMDLYD